MGGGLAGGEKRKKDDLGEKRKKNSRGRGAAPYQKEILRGPKRLRA